MKKAAKFLMVLAVLVLLSPQKQFARENKGYIQLILHISLSTGLSPAGTEVTLSYGYYAVADSTGTVVFDSIPEGHYDISAFKIGYDAYHLNNVYISEDKVYNIVLSEKKYPPACLSVDPLSLTGTWCEPMITALDQDFEDPVFPPPGWQFDPEENGWELINGDSAGSGGIPEWESYYILSAGNINGAPEAMITPPADLRESENYIMTLDSYYDGSYGGLAFLEYSLDDCETWEVLYQVMPNSSWTELEIDLGWFSGPSGPEQIWFAFVADDNGGWAPVWAIDNVKILVPDQPANYIDFWVFLNDTLVGETTNTSWDFAPLSYGQSFTASVAARYTSGLSSKDYVTFTSEYLIPPDSLTGFAPDDAAILTWDPPLDSLPGPVWGLPENLLGYNIYRNGTFIDYTPHTPPGEITPQFYIDEGISPGCYEYTVTAVYDITPYGFPGDSAESMEEGPVEVIGGCCFELDFMETWEQGNFEDNYWFVDGENWSVNGQAGTPSPAAEFTWDPIQENYAIALESYTFAAAGMTEGKIYMDFDLKLDAVASTGEEKLIVGVKWDWESEVWDTVAAYSNTEGSFGWSAEHIDITSLSMGKVFRVRFLATGSNSLSLLGWLVDNIHIYRTCDAPSNLVYGFFSDGVELTWEPPILSSSEALKSVDDGSRDLAGYNIYRSKDSEDYILLDFSDEPAYFDSGDDLIENSYYCYMVTAVWESETDQCVSSFSNEACLMVSIESHDPASIFSIYPNPASDFLVIVPEKSTSDREIFVSVYNSAGILILKKEFNNDGAEIKLDLGGLPSGVYWVTTESNSSPVKASKFIIF